MFFSDHTFLHIIVIVVSSLTAMSGIADSWTSPMMSKLASDGAHSKNHATHLSTSQESLVASLLQLGCAFGCVASIYTGPNIGKKKTVVLFGTLSLTSYLLIGFGGSLGYIYCARFLAGFGSSCCLTVLPQYIEDLVGDSKKKRSAHTFMGVFLAVGVLFSFVAGPYATVREFSFVCMTFIGVLLLVFNVWVPESPVFLASSGDRAATERCLKKLRRGFDQNALAKEVEKVFARIQEQRSESKKPYGLKMPPRSFAICVILLCFQELTGTSIVLSFMQEIFEKTSHPRPKLASLIVGGTNLLSAVFVASIMESVKKRHLLWVSCAGCCLSLGLFGLYFYVKSNFSVVAPVDMLPVASLMCYVLSFNAGLGHVTWVISTEVFRPEADLLASSIAHATGKFVAFSLTLGFPYVSEVVGYDCYFWALSVCCLLALLFVIVFVKAERIDEASDTNKCESTHVPP